MESVIRVGEMTVHVILAGMFALAPGIIVWLALTTIVIALQRLKRLGWPSSGLGEEEMLFT